MFSDKRSQVRSKLVFLPARNHTTSPSRGQSCLSFLDMAKKTHQLGLHTCDLDGGWIPTFQGRCGHGNSGSTKGAVLRGPLLQTVRPHPREWDWVLSDRTLHASSMWPGKPLAVPNSVGSSSPYRQLGGAQGVQRLWCCHLYL